jgi:tetratricopeptide (TPR) repeat protein
MRRLRGPDDPEVGAILAELANVAVWSDDLEEGEKNARAAVEIYKSVPALHPDHIMADYRLASILLYRGRLSEAGPLFERALRAQRQVFGSRNSIVADTLASLAEVRKAQNNSTQAELLVREAISAHRDSDSKIYHKIGYLQTMLATILIEQQKFGEAEDLLRGALDLFAKSLPPDHQYVASAEHYLGECLMETGKLIDAEATLTAAMNRWKRTEAPPWRSARSASALGEVLYRENRMQDAERYLVSSFRVLNADQSADQDVKKTKSKARERISRFYIARGQRNKLDEILRKAASDEPAARGH